MKKQILKAIKNITNFPQHMTCIYEDAIEDVVGNADITTETSELKNVAFELVMILISRELLEYEKRGEMFYSILEAMGVY